jgi:hypothetical protein
MSRFFNVGRLNRLVGRLYNRPAQRTAQLTALEQDFKRQIEELERSHQQDQLTVGDYWANNLRRFREHVLQEDLLSFIRWDVITPMFAGNEPYIAPEFAELQRHPAWEARWKPALHESCIGNPIRYWRAPWTSGNVIHHAYHIMRLEELIRHPIEDYKLIFEFGGGYGNFCRLIHRLGFKGTYVIFDLPEYSMLQRYYLAAHGLPVRDAGDCAQDTGNIYCLSDFAQLNECLSANACDQSLFVAMWSFSESPAALREKFDALLAKITTHFVGYQSQFDGVDNIKFFEDYIRLFPQFAWTNLPIPQINPSYYLFGSRMDTI